MDAAAAAAPSRRAKTNRGRPLVPPNYVSLRDLQELRLREKEEQRRREEEEAAARRAREEQRKRQEEEEAAAARRFIEERRRREEEAVARRARDAAAAKPEVRASSSSHASSFRNTERDRGGQRLVVVADRPPPRGECAAVKIDGATGGGRGRKGPDGGAANAPLGGGFRVQNEGKGKVSTVVAAGPGEPARPAAASSEASKPDEKRKGEASGRQDKSLLGAMPARTSSASGELANVDSASYRGPGRPKHWQQGKKKGLNGRSTETDMTSSTDEAVEASPLPAVNLENKGKSGMGDRSSETASATMPGKAAEASPPRGVKSDNKGKKKPSGGRQVGAAPSSDLEDGKVEAFGCEGTTSGVINAPGDQADADGASYRMPARPTYRRRWKKSLDGRSTETATANVAGKATDASPIVGVNAEIKGEKGLIEQGTETALARNPIEAADASLARGFLSENKEKKESSGGRHTAGRKAQPCPAAEGNGSHRSNVGQGTTWEAKTEGFQGKQTAVVVKAQPQPAAESSGYLRSSGDQGKIQAAKSDVYEEKQRVVETRTVAQLNPCDTRNSGRQRPGSQSRVNVTARQHGMVWVPKGC